MTTTKALLEPEDLSDEKLAELSAREMLAAFPQDWLPWLLEGLRALRPFQFPPLTKDDDVRDPVFDFDLEEERAPKPKPSSLPEQLPEMAKQLRSFLNGGNAEAAFARFCAEARISYTAVDDQPMLDALQRFVLAAQRNGVDFGRTLLKLAGQSSDPEVVFDAALQRLGQLTALHVVDAGALISRDRLIELSGQNGAFPASWNSLNAWRLERDPTTLFFWMRADLNDALQVVTRLVDNAAESDVARLTKGVLWEIGCWIAEVGGHRESYAEKGPVFQNGVERLLMCVVARAKSNETLLRAPLYLECVFRLAWMAFDKREPEMPTDLKTMLIRAAKPELARLRSQFAATTKEAAVPWLEREIHHIRAVDHALFALSTLWDGMKPLLLLVRAAPVPIFPPDLSWWTVRAPMSNAVGSLANAMMFYFQSYARFEQNSDETLKELRTELAAFCLDRLKRRDKDSDEPKEPDPIWRACAIRAAGELGVNPDGKGHRILHHVMEHDVDEQVRAAAKRVYPDLREGRPYAASSPRVAVLHALWWLRQAQLRALGIEIDPEGAQRTRSEEVRYTTMKKEKTTKQ